ncbi:hypothetical protein, partial [Klebsiella aerogenes]|uniref:hypothetical protein n=1 Tax=Klebsiella aerogenes TaxID=548 RepID=UPI001953B675
HRSIVSDRNWPWRELTTPRRRRDIGRVGAWVVWGPSVADRPHLPGLSKSELSKVFSTIQSA